METLSEDEDDPYAGDVSESISIRANLFGSPSSGQGYSPAPGGPFSALTPSMWPQDLLATLAQVIRNFIINKSICIKFYMFLINCQLGSIN